MAGSWHGRASSGESSGTVQRAGDGPWRRDAFSAGPGGGDTFSRCAEPSGAGASRCAAAVVKHGCDTVRHQCGISERPAPELPEHHDQCTWRAVSWRAVSYCWVCRDCVCWPLSHAG